MTKADFVARRLNDAMKGWGADKGAMARLMGGLDGDGMAATCGAFERKYGRPLKSALIAELSGNIERAATVWVSSLQDPSRGLEAKTEADFAELAGDEAALQVNTNTNSNSKPNSNSSPATRPCCKSTRAPPTQADTLHPLPPPLATT